MNNFLKTLNSPIELGTRSALILTVTDRQLSLDDLVLLDYALLYSEEFGGPKSLHPALPNNIAEIAHRREYLPKALSLFIQKGVVSVEANDSGYYYLSNERTLDFVSCLQQPYFRKAWVILDWISENCQWLTDIDLARLKERKI